jgi:hypothetical protein
MVAAGQQESRTRGILREAIRKVMEEIEYHEKEAQQHLQQAAQLRKDLRDSLAFLQKQGEKAAPTAVPGDRPAKTGEPSAGKERPAANRRPRSGKRKKPAVRKATKG